MSTSVGRSLSRGRWVISSVYHTRIRVYLDEGACMYSLFGASINQEDG